MQFHEGITALNLGIIVQPKHYFLKQVFADYTAVVIALRLLRIFFFSSQENIC